MKVSITQHFDAAHYLPNYPGPCSKMHGHRWLVRIIVTGEVDFNTGMVLDFGYLKQKLNETIGRFDHSVLNDHLANPTAENIALYIKEALPKKVTNVRVYETPTSWAEA